VFCSPISNKLKIFSNDELLIKEILIEGILSIQAGDNPRIIEEKLKSFLSPALRKTADSESAGD
jgi:chemotaxis protein MotA